MAKTNLEMLLGAIEKAKKENMVIIESTQLTIKKEDEVEQNIMDFVVLSNNKGYLVNVVDGEITHCNCPSHKFHGICKHMVKVSLDKKINIKGL